MSHPPWGLWCRAVPWGLWCQGSLDVDGLGQVFVTGGGIHPSGGALTITHNSGISITNSCLEDWDPHSFTNFKLIGKTLAYTADLSGVGCACNLAFYLIQEPALDASGNPSMGTCSDSPYYCDANQVCGQWCTELDIMEANSHTFAATPHRCDPSSTPQFMNCDRGGQGRNTKDMGAVYGPGAGNTIDTTQPFEVHTSFDGNPSAGTFTGMTTVLKQGGRSLEFANQGGAGYLAGMAAAMKSGLALRITYWGDTPVTMNWLDDPVCGDESCHALNAGKATISDIRIFPIPGAAPPVQPQPQPTPVPVTTAAPEPQQEKSSALALSWVLAGAGLLLVTLSAYQSQHYLEEALHRCLDRYEDGIFSGALKAMEAQQGQGNPSKLQEVLGKAQEVLAVAIDFTALLTQRIRTYWCYFTDIFTELSRQRAWNREAFQVALHTAGARESAVQHEGFEVGERVVVMKPFKSGGANLQPGTAGRIQMMMIDAKGGSAVVAFDGQPVEVALTQDQLLNLEAEDAEEVVESRRRDAKMLMCSALSAVVLLVILLSVHRSAASGSSSASQAVAAAIPPGGCCSWDKVTCGSTTDWCKSQAHCESDCLGSWMPR